VSVVANVAINIDGKQAQSLLKAIQGEVEKLNGSFDQIPKKTGGIFDKLKGAASSAIGQLAAVTGAAFTLQQAFTTLADQSKAEGALRTLGVDADAATQQFTQLSKELKGQASVVELTAAAYDVASAGFLKTADQTKILEAATKGAVGGMSDINTVGNAVTSVLNAYGMSADQAGLLVDGFIQTQNDGKIILAEYAALVGRLAPLGAAAGVGIKELNAAVATITAQGVKPEAAVTGLAQAISSILKPTSEAQKLAKELGIDFTETGLKSKGLGGFLNEVATATGGSSSKLTQLFGSLDAVKALLPLLSGDMKKFAENTLKQDKAAGVATKAFNDMAETLGGALKEVDTAFKNLVVAFKPITPAIIAPFKVLAGAINLVTENIKALAVAAVFIGTFAAVLNASAIATKAWAIATGLLAAAKKAAGIAAAFLQGVMNPGSLATTALALGAATAAAVTLGNAMNESGLKAEEAKLKQDGVAGATAAVKDEAAKLIEETNKQAAALDQIPPKIEDAEEKTKQLKKAQDAVTKAISESSEAIDKTAAMNQAIADQRSSSAAAYLQAEMQVNDVLLDQLNRQLDGAKTRKDRLKIAGDIYKLTVAQAKLEFEASKIQISAAVEKAHLALQATELKVKEVQLAVELATAEGKVNDSHRKSLVLAGDAEKLASIQLGTTKLIAEQQMRGANALLQGKIQAAGAAFESNILAKNTNSAASAAERLATGFQQAADAASSMSDNTTTKAIYGATTTTKTLPAGAIVTDKFGRSQTVGGSAAPRTEHIVPQSKEAGFATVSGSSAIPSGSGGSGGGSPTISIQTGPVMQMNGTNYVTTQDLSSAVQAGVQQTLNMMRNDRGTRRSIGLA
jgi:TP901 family phage tail tape measure protein